MALIEKTPVKTSQLAILFRCFRYLRPHWKLTAGAYLTMLIIDIFNMVNPQLIRWTIDNSIGGKNTQILMVAVGALLVLVIIKGIFTYFQGVWTEIASQNVAYDIRNELQRKITFLACRRFLL